MRRHVSLLVLILFAWMSAVSTAPAAELLLDRDEVLRAAAEVTREAYPNADDVLVDDIIRCEYQADGTSVTRDDTYMKVLTEKGKRDNQTLSLHFTLPYSTIACEVLEVIKPDGRVVSVDVAGQSRVMVDPSQMQANIYNPNAKILKVGVPGVEIGDVVHYYYVRKTVKPRVPETWSDWQVFEYTSPIRRLEYEVVGPKELPLRRIALKDEVPNTVAFTRRAEADRIRYRWVVTDVPRMYEEPSMPPLHTVVQRLLVSTIPDWQAISKWYWNLSKPHFETTEGIRKQVAELTEGKDDRRARIEAIFQYVSQKIRYMGITTEKEAPGYEPHDVRITFENKYGVCRDKAALLVAMLREAGFKAYPVLIHNGPKKDPDVPQPYFNHAVVAVAQPDGGYLLMDSTDENTKELFPAYLGNQSYLVAKPEGEELLTSPIVPASENMMRIETTARLGADGALTGESTLRFEGINDNAYRGHFARLKPEERRQFFEARAKRVAAGATLTDFDIRPADMLDTSQPLTVRLAFEAHDITVANATTAMLPLPMWGAGVGIVNFVLGRTGLEKRTYPLQTDVACGVEETLTLDVTGALGQPVSLPAYGDIDSEMIAWDRGLTFEGGVLKGSLRFALKGVEFTPEQYAGLKDALEVMEIDGRKMPIFRTGAATAGEEADALVLSEEVSYELADAHNWTETRTVRTKILTYAGKKSYAELKFRYNPAWEALALEKAVVTAPDGTVKAVGETERNLMDADWVGSAPRYPGEKLLVANLPSVDVGSVVEYRVVRTKMDRPMFAARESFRTFEPIQSKRVRVAGPAAALPRTDERRIESAGPNTWAAEDQPAVKRERSLPPLWAFTPTVVLSNGAWPHYAQRVEQALGKAAADQPEAAAKANALVRGAAGPKAAVMRIRDFVAKQIRAAGPSLDDLPLSAVTPADRTLADGYGNTTDRAVLLHAMLSAAGHEPVFVLASRQRPAEGLDNPLADYPDPSAFGQVLVRTTLAGTAVYLNDTSQYDALGATGHDGCYGLDTATGEVTIIEAVPGYDEKSETAFDVTLDAAGNAVITRTRLLYGGAYGALKKHYAELPPEERRREFQELVGSISRAAKPKGDLTTRFDTYPGVESFTVTVPSYAIRDGRHLYFYLPETLGSVPGVTADTRTNPLYWAQQRHRVIRTQLELPEGLTDAVLIPPEGNWAVGGAAGAVWRRVERPEPDVLVLTETLRLDPAVIPAGTYPDLLRMDRRLRHARTRTVLLTGE